MHFRPGFRFTHPDKRSTSPKWAGLMATLPIIIATIGLIDASSRYSFASSESVESNTVESVDHTPSFQIWQSDPVLRDLFDSSGESPLCWPASLAHRMAYQKWERIPSFSNLLPVPHVNRDGDNEHLDEVRYFAHQCKTTPDDGTSLKNGLACIRGYYQNSKLQPWAYAIGINAFDWPTDASQSSFLKPVSTADIREYVAKDYGVMLHIGWFTRNRHGQWTNRTGGHYVNIYGYDYEKGTGESKMDLRITNPLRVYPDASGNWSDAVTAELEGDRYLLRGTGFASDTKHGYIEDIVVFLPE